MSNLFHEISPPFTDFKSLARAITLIENSVNGYEDFLLRLPSHNQTKIIGITGPPGAGKSTLVDGIIENFISQNKRVAVLCIDPSSPFNMGALLGDRIRMSEWYNHPHVFIRSLASRGNLGGLHPKIIEITDVVKAAQFDHIVIETVGVGQSEVEIAGLADTTVVVLMPESGDQVQTMKAGLMEIADIFVVNKADRPNADTFIKNLNFILSASYFKTEVAVVKTIASEKQGLKELHEKILLHQQHTQTSERHYWLLAEKAYYLIQQNRMSNISKSNLKESIEKESTSAPFNLYRFVKQQLG